MIYIHTGLHKTGTTFLQERVFPFLDLVYDPKDLSDLIYKAVYSEVDKLEADKILKKYKNKTVLISNESLLVDFFPVEKREGIEIGQTFDSHEKIRKIIPDAKMIICLRNQVDYIRSMYIYSHKKRLFKTLEEFLDYNGNINSLKIGDIKLDKHCLKYSKVIERYEKYFETYTFFYEDFRDDTEKSVKDLLNFIGVEGKYFDYSVVNKGISILYCIIGRYIWNLFGLFNSINEMTNWSYAKKNYSLGKLILVAMAKVYRKLVNPLVRGKLKLLYKVKINYDPITKDMKREITEIYKEDNKKISGLVENLPEEYK